MRLNFWSRPALSIFIFMIVAWLPRQAQAQDDPHNLVPNGGFEENLDEPGDEADYQKLTHWFNAGSARDYPSGTPDYLSRSGSGKAYLPASYYGRVQPYTGRRIAGLVAYNQFEKDFREYLTVKLKEPMEPGGYYTFIMMVTNGLGDNYGKLGVNGLGVLFSENIHWQRRHEPLKVITPYQMALPLFTHYWVPLTWHIAVPAQSPPLNYLTIGNFTPADTLLKILRPKGEKGRLTAYYFFDDVTLRRDSVPKTEAERKKYDPDPAQLQRQLTWGERPVQGSQHPPSEIKGRPVEVQETIEVESDEITLLIMDTRELDGDVVTVVLNGRDILSKYKMRRRRHKIQVRLRPGWNYLSLHADNVGNIPPNTATLTLKDKDKTYKMSLTSSYKHTGTLQIWHAPEKP